MNLQNPQVKSVQSDLSTWLSVTLIPDLFTGKRLDMDFLYLYLNPFWHRPMTLLLIQDGICTKRANVDERNKIHT